MEMPVESPCKVIPYGVIGHSISFCETDGYVGAGDLFVRCFEGIKFMAKISLSHTFLKKSSYVRHSSKSIFHLKLVMKFH